MKKIIILFCVCFVTIATFAQKELHNWTFGQNCGLTWNTTRSADCTGEAGTANATLDGLPTFFRSSIYTTEGCFSLSDKDGNLLFYSDGIKLWDKNNTEVTDKDTRFTGSSTSAQSGILLPYPGYPDRYLAVTVGYWLANNLSYSVINMNTSTGLPELDLSQLNVLFQNGSGKSGESVSAVLHENGTDYWIIGIGRDLSLNRAYLNAWLLTKDGVSATPVVTPFYHAQSNATPDQSRGYLKLTPDGKYFAWATFTANSFHIGNFDPSTGTFSNIKQTTMINGAKLDEPYGVEFSIDQSLLYLTDKKGLYVYKTDAIYTGSTLLNAPAKTFTISNMFSTGLQMAPDGRIYWACGYAGWLRIIDNTNDFDNIKVYKAPSDFLESGTTVMTGLPSFSPSWFSISEVSENVKGCRGYGATYSVKVGMKGDPSTYPTKLVWDFGDSSGLVEQAIVSGVEDYSLAHAFTASGEYTVTVTPYRANGSALAKTQFKTQIKDCLVRVNRNVRSNLRGQ